MRRHDKNNPIEMATKSRQSRREWRESERRMEREKNEEREEWKRKRDRENSTINTFRENMKSNDKKEMCLINIYLPLNVKSSKTHLVPSFKFDSPNNGTQATTVLALTKHTRHLCGRHRAQANIQNPVTHLL
jgi:hypothetical protein